VHAPHNLQSTHEEKVSKYVELGQLVKEEWRVEKVTSIPGVISAKGVVLKSMPVAIKSLQIEDGTIRGVSKAVVLATISIVRSLLGGEVSG